ncbi:Fic family protein [Spirosoma sp. KUDC1026]|uniref:Fic family protein n=1 Tax=Spirosoma sp. KUDC1026 TaxID=2745947 RepID=UPI00159B9573|nr:Fic family protein [Spirosoma sp. KUDC1026]QKZ15426.1 Fic family protein [Spirosoma sp. KUDC1026]
MSKPIRRIELDEFAVLVDAARLIHASRDEPIPELAQDNWDNVEYALTAPFAYVYGHTPYRGFIKKASIQFYLFAKGHRLVNGNKRIACVSLNYFCIKNDRTLNISNDDLVALARYTANSDPLAMPECLDYINDFLKGRIT